MAVVGAALGMVLTAPALAGPWRVVVRGGAEDVSEAPVVAVVKADLTPGDYRLAGEAGTAPVPAQVFVDEGKTYLAAVLKNTPARSVQTLTLEPSTASSRPGVEIRKEGASLDVFTGGRRLLTYVSDQATKPYYYPVIGPTGAPITRAYPMKDVPGEDRDHNHQRSMWFTHGNVNGFDFWASDPKNRPSPKFGSIKETARPTVVAGSVAGVIRTADDWLGPDGSKVCEDERVLRVFETAAGRVLDFEVTVRAPSAPVTFKDTKEGSFGLRVASSMDVKRKLGGKILNAEGLTDGAAWGKPSPWVDYTGPVEGKAVGVAILNHPESFRYPTTWHVRDYGLFAANPFGWHDFGLKKSGDHAIPAGGSMRLAYRVVLHEGAVDVPALFRAYASPPSVEVSGG
jgi:hypothetical protein